MRNVKTVFTGVLLRRQQAAGRCRIDPNLLEWPENDFRIFVGDLGNETNDEVLNKAFQRFPTFNKAKVVRDKKTNKTKGGPRSVH